MTGRILQLRLFVALMLIGIGVVTTSTLVLYEISIKSISDRVETMSRSYARLINSAARFDKANFPDSPQDSAREGTFLQVRQAQLNSTGFGDTGEYVLGELNGDRIDFLLPARKTGKIPAGIDPEPWHWPAQETPYQFQDATEHTPAKNHGDPQ